MISLVLHCLALFVLRTKKSAIPLSLPLLVELRQPPFSGDPEAAVSSSQTSKPLPAPPSLHQTYPNRTIRRPFNETRQAQRTALAISADSSAQAPEYASYPAKRPFDSSGSATPAKPDYHPPLFHAAYLDNPRPGYPLAARRRGLEGTVRIEVTVGADGLVRDLRLKSTSGSSDLDESALGAVRRWRFVPARQGAETVEGKVTVPIRFRLNDFSEGDH